MKLFDIKGNEVILNANILGIPPFIDLWTRDESQSKAKARKEISYVTFLCDNTIDNPYRVHSEKEREGILRKDYIKDENWKPDKVVLAAIEKFKAFQDTPIARRVKAAKVASEKLDDYFRTVKITSDETAGKVLDNITKLKRAIDTIDDLEDKLLKEQTESTARGGVEIGIFEMPDSHKPEPSYTTSDSSDKE